MAKPALDRRLTPTGHQRRKRSLWEKEMANQSTAEDRLIDRRSVLRTGVALAAAGPALLHAEHAKAQPRPDGASPTTIIDAQVHAYAANTPERPWHSVPNWPPHVTSDEMVVAMNKVAHRENDG
jgi:hypothetical protein